VTARSFIWIAIGGGAWSLAENWDDVTDGVNPSALVPGAQDSVTVPGPSGTDVQTITGSGTVASAVFTGNTILSGSFSAAALTVGTAATGGVLQIAANATLKSSGATLEAGSLLVNGSNAALFVSGTLGVGDGLTDGLSASLNVTAGGTASVLGLLMDVANCEIYVDPASVLEVGALGSGRAGYLTVDPGDALTGEGDANAYGDVANNGTITASGGTLSLGTLSGSGTLLIGAGATLELDGACGAGQSVDFTGANGVLDLQAEYYAPQGGVAGFAPGDSIDESGSLISSASFSASGAAGGVLTLYYGSQIAGTITLSGNYLGDSFLTSGDGSDGTLITVATAASGGGTASPGTSTPDQYLWVGPSSASWNTAANWDDQTSGADPAAVAPGVKNIVTIAASQGSFTLIAGPANAASLSVTGELALSGKFGVGTLDIGTSSATSFTNGTLDLVPGTSITGTGATIAAGEIAVAGSGATLSLSGTLAMGGGSSGVGLPVTALTVTSGGKVKVGKLTIGGGSADSITTDPTGSVEVGTLGSAAAGAVTIDKGATLTGNGSINPLGPVIDNGKIVATGGVMTLGTVTGNGSLQINNGLLDLNYTTALPIQFVGANATLAIAGYAACPAGVVSDMVEGDLIDIIGDTIDAAQFNTNADSTEGTVQLWYSSTLLGQFVMSGNFANDQMINVPDGAGGTYLELVPLSIGGGGTGQSGTDQLAWTGSQDGDWSNAGNWNDITTGSVATLPPGPQTPTTIAAPGGTQYASITGTGTCASLALSGNIYLLGTFATGALTFGSDATSSSAAVGGTLATYPTTTLTAASAFIADGLIQPGANNVLIDVTGTLTMGDGGASPLMIVQAGGMVQAGALAMGGGNVSVDAYSSVEIGTLGTGALGTITVDPGFAVSGEGTLNVLGDITDNGLITAQGGTLVVGAVSGTGSIAIATEAALSLTGSETVGIGFAGAGATLILDTTSDIPAAVITGFAIGDGIVEGGSPIDSVSYLPGSHGIGTLTLSEAGQVQGTLLLAGNYAGDSFSVQPDGEGAEITVSVASAGGSGGPPPGTATQDQYVWTGGHGALWATASNWKDTTQGQNPAAVAPGQNDLVTFAASGAPLQVTGPGNAAVLTLTGTVALAGAVAAGTLAIGTAQVLGDLALGSGDEISAGSAVVSGGVAGAGGTLNVAGLMTLGDAAAGGLLDATGATWITAEAALLQGTASALMTDASGSIEIGGTLGAPAGSVTIDAGGLIEGAGSVNPAGQVVDDGMVLAAQGTLLVGAASGTGTLMVGLGATLVLEGAVAPGLVVDFAGAGTLVVAGSGFDGTIEDFGPSDTILLPVNGATSAAFALTGPDTGVVSVLDGSTVLQELSFWGSAAGEVFDVGGEGGGGTILTAAPANTAGEGGDTVPSDTLVPGSNILTATQLQSLAEDNFPYAAAFVQALDDNESCDLWYLDGETTVGPPLYGPGGATGVDIELVAPTEGDTGSPSGYTLQAGYSALIAEGTEPVTLFDTSVGDALLVGNANVDPQYTTDLVTTEDNDTLVGATGGNTVFWASGGAAGTEYVTVQGGGNDTIVTNEDNAMITTSGGGHSLVNIGSSDNYVLAQGDDEIVCGGTVGGVAHDTVDAAGAPGITEPTVFGPADGEVLVHGEANAAIVVGGGGQILMDGGAAAGNVLWAGTSPAEYFGGAGSGIVIGGSNFLYVQGGVGPVTVYGGTGRADIEGSTGTSTYVVGEGATTVAAGAGNTVFVTGSAPVSVSGASGVVVYAGQGTGNYVFDANAGSETLWGGAAKDQFYAGSGNDNMVSGGGVDVFNFTNGLGGGSDIIYNFVPGKDLIALHGFGGAVPALSVQSGSTYFSLSDGTHVEVAYVTNLTAASFSSS
jgi:hypothetical protein